MIASACSSRKRSVPIRSIPAAPSPSGRPFSNAFPPCAPTTRHTSPTARRSSGPPPAPSSPAAAEPVLACMKKDLSDAPRQTSDVEVDQQAGTAAGEFQMGKQPGAVPIRDPVGTQGLDDQLARNQQLDLDAGDQDETPVANRNRLVLLERDATVPKLLDERESVNGFEQAGPEDAVHLRGGRDDRPRPAVAMHLSPVRVRFRDTGPVVRGAYARFAPSGARITPRERRSRRKARR